MAEFGGHILGKTVLLLNHRTETVLEFSCLLYHAYNYQQPVVINCSIPFFVLMRTTCVRSDFYIIIFSLKAIVKIKTLHFFASVSFKYALLKVASLSTVIDLFK